MTDLAARTTGETVSVVLVLGIASLLLLVLAAVLLIAALWRVFVEAGEPGWAAVVPFYNIWVLLRVTGKPAWWVVLWFIPVANWVVGALTYRQLARQYGRGAWFTLGLVLLAPVFLPILAFAPRPAAGRARRGSAAPWIAAAGALVLVAALAVTYFVVPDKEQPAGALTGRELSAVTAAGTIAANAETYARATFAHDYARALAGTTGSLYTSMSQLRSVTQERLTSGKFDLSARVRRSALVGPIDPSGKTSVVGYVVLVNMYNYLSTAPANPIPQNLEVTVQLVKGKWKANDITSVGIQ